jgi:dolichyl-phosphate-mannose--protein O-mannosyl transferase
VFRNLSHANREMLAFAALAALSFALHFIHLTQPAQVVFDEYHFGKFVNAYCCSHETIFDIHPPHSKLVMAWIVKLWGYDGGVGFKTIGESLAGAPIFAFRLWPALVGSLLPLVAFKLLRHWRVPLAWAFTGGFALALENGILIQTRIMALDGQLLLGSLLSVLMCEKMLAARKSSSKIIYGLLVGLSLALTVSAKFTGLAVIAILGFQLAQNFMHSGMKWSWTRTSSATVLASLVGFLGLYLAGWWLHFLWLTKPGPGSAFYSVTGNFLNDVFALHKIMLKANNGITTEHPWTSIWWEWPIMQKPIYYWVDQGASIYFVGNPGVWWGCHLVCLALVGFRRTMQTNLLALGWIASFVPYAFVSRGLFLYHYLPPLMWVILLATVLLSQQSKSGTIKPWHAMVLIVCGFLITAPVTFGFVGWKEIPVVMLNLR